MGNNETSKTPCYAKNGDYVLATKYFDGDPGDHWCLGFYDCATGDRHFVLDGEGRQIRHNGFRRVRKIRADVGRWLLEVAAKQLEMSPPGTVNLWNMLTESAFDTDEPERIEIEDDD